MAWIESGAVATIIVIIAGAIAKWQFVSRRECDKNHERKREMIRALDDRMKMDEREYLTKELHKEICTGNTEALKHHITAQIHAVRDEILAAIKRNGAQ